jgi:hypothetical protein
MLEAIVNMPQIDNGFECRLKIGDVCCSLVLNSQRHCSSLKSYYNNFLSNEEPDFTVYTNITQSEEKIVLPVSIIMSKTVDGNNFNFHSGLIKGSINREARKCTIDVNHILFRRIRLFEHFLFQIYYTVLNDLNSKKSESFLLHACSVEKEGTGYVFTGPPESGKSTIARLSSKHNVLGDEIALIKEQNENYYIESTPFRGDFKESNKGKVKLGGIFLIKHGKKNIIREIGKKEFVTSFIREIIYPATLLSTDKLEIYSKMFEISSSIADTVPFYELSFLPDETFWNNINTLKVKI